MELCQTCPQKASKTCHQICPKIQGYLNGLRNYKTTYVNKEVGLNVVHANQIHESLAEYGDTSGSFTEKFGHLLPTIERIVLDHLVIALRDWEQTHHVAVEQPGYGVSWRVLRTEC